MKATEKQKASFKEYYKKHRPQMLIERREYYWAHRKERLTQKKEYYYNTHKYYYHYLKLRIIEHYSGKANKCAKCGFDDIRALSIDHINGGGNQHKLKIKGHLYKWLECNNFPLGFQVLCMNCQFIKREENNECQRKRKSDQR